VSDDDAPPIWMTYEGDGFKLLPGYSQKLADKHYVIGEKYRMLNEHERSAKSHRHYFACIKDAHSNMPESMLELHPSPEALRKHALIRTGYCDQNTFVCASAAEARRMAAWLTPVDEFCIIVSARNVVTRYTAKSQSVKAMGNVVFQLSKDAVLTWIAEQIGTTKTALEANTGQSGEGAR
jgi:hypothetical protein